MTLHLTVDEAKHFMGRYGFFVRDEGLLASAVARPSTSIMGRDAFGSLELKAAVLFESAASNHPLGDGDKRMSWTLMVLFLWLNGYRHDFDTDAAFDLAWALPRVDCPWKNRRPASEPVSFAGKAKELVGDPA